jgi:putative transposon-encoded protein
LVPYRATLVPEDVTLVPVRANLVHNGAISVSNKATLVPNGITLVPDARQTNFGAGGKILMPDRAILVPGKANLMLHRTTLLCDKAILMHVEHFICMRRSATAMPLRCHLCSGYLGVHERPNKTFYLEIDKRRAHRPRHVQDHARGGARTAPWLGTSGAHASR